MTSEQLSTSPTHRREWISEQINLTSLSPDICMATSFYPQALVEYHSEDLPDERQVSPSKSSEWKYYICVLGVGEGRDKL